MATTTGELPNLSEQRLIDCTTNGGNHGCEDGWGDSAFDYIVQNRGISSEDSLPHIEVEAVCNTVAASTAAMAQISRYKNIPRSKHELLKAMAMQPVSITLSASSNEFKNYIGCVFEGPCGSVLDHVVVIVGYGMTGAGIDYWLIRNSRSEDGYMRIRRNSGIIGGGLCGLALLASHPVI